MARNRTLSGKDDFGEFSSVASLALCTKRHTARRNAVRVKKQLALDLAATAATPLLTWQARPQWRRADHKKEPPQGERGGFCRLGAEAPQ